MTPQVVIDPIGTVIARRREVAVPRRIESVNLGTEYTMAVVTLEPFSSEQLLLLERWLHEAHVAPWYPHPSRDLEYASRPPRNAGHWLIAVDAEPVGYVRWQHVDRETLDGLGLLEVPANSVDIDILLGDVASTGKGIGPAALNLVARRFLPDTSVPQLGLTTSVHNSRAHRGFAKAGFVITRQYQPPGLERCHLMIRDIAAERANGPSD